MTTPESAVTLATPNKQRSSAGLQFPAGGALAVVRDPWHSDPFFRLGFGLGALVVGPVVFAPWLAPHDPRVGDLQNAYLRMPGGRFLLGTNPQGRDVRSQAFDPKLEAQR
jgi:ABC-type dipeptide/oligopeptide/nickel transport system permease subunit